MHGYLYFLQGVLKVAVRQKSLTIETIHLFHTFGMFSMPKYQEFRIIWLHLAWSPNLYRLHRESILSTDTNVICKSTSRIYYNDYKIKAPLMSVSVFYCQLRSTLP